MKQIIIFASGNGSNAVNLIHTFSKQQHINVKGVFCNNPKAGIIPKAKTLNVPVYEFTKKELEAGNVLAELKLFNLDLIVLAGFLLKIPNPMVEYFENKIVNIHPSLLPKYGGAGMYGDHVHKAVLKNKEVKSGISIHLVDHIYDNGTMLFQAEVDISEDETLDSLKTKIQKLEHEHFPKVVEHVLKDQ